MKSVWISNHGIRNVGIRYPARCVVCGKNCNETKNVGAEPTDMATGGIRFLVGFVRKFSVPMHINGKCDRIAIKRLRKVALYPVVFIAFCAIIIFFLSILIDPLFSLLIFVALIPYFTLGFLLERNKNWPIRITESFASGDGGAYEFEFYDDCYADEFGELNKSIISK